MVLEDIAAGQRGESTCNMFPQTNNHCITPSDLLREFVFPILTTLDTEYLRLGGSCFQHEAY